MVNPEIAIKGVAGLPEVDPGTRLGTLIAETLKRESAEVEVEANDIFVVAQKIVSKAEGDLVRLAAVAPSARAKSWARTWHKDPRVVEVVLRQSRRIVRMKRGVLIAETHHGFVCANAGVDASNTPEGSVTLLPQDPDLSAEEIRLDLEKAFEIPVGVIVTDTFGRPWREGLVNVALGVSGVRACVDYRGERDSFGKQVRLTVMALADELAAAAGLVMGKTNRIPVVQIRGISRPSEDETAEGLLRSAERDLFR